MDQASAADAARAKARFHHEALLYRGTGELVGAVASFVSTGLAAGGRALVALPEPKLGPLRLELGGTSAAVTMLDMQVLGRNPGRLTSIWHRHALEANAEGAVLWGVGEPVWPGRSGAEVVEARLHEALLNEALRDTSTLLLCPYEVDALSPETLDSARATHDRVRGEGIASSDRHGGDADHTSGSTPDVFAGPLPPAGGAAGEVAFEGPTLRPVRAVVEREGRAAGLPERRLHDLVLAVSELAANTIRHSGGPGLLRWWTEAAEHRQFVCEVVDAGRIRDRLVGRTHPTPSQLGGRGLWLVHHLCDLVQERSTETGTTVRVMMGLPDPSHGDG